MPDIMSIEANWQHGFHFDVHTGTGHDLTVDASPEVGGNNDGPRPIELLLVANATCMGMDVISILQKMRQEVRAYRLRVTGERSEDHPKVFTHILIEHFIEGDVEEGKLAHAIRLSEEKYCSVSAMLDKVAKIETSYVLGA
jgi:putative redox protein